MKNDELLSNLKITYFLEVQGGLKKNKKYRKLYILDQKLMSIIEKQLEKEINLDSLSGIIDIETVALVLKELLYLQIYYRIDNFLQNNPKREFVEKLLEEAVLEKESFEEILYFIKEKIVKLNDEILSNPTEHKDKSIIISSFPEISNNSTKRKISDVLNYLGDFIRNFNKELVDNGLEPLNKFFNENTITPFLYNLLDNENVIWTILGENKLHFNEIKIPLIVLKKSPQKVLEEEGYNYDKKDMKKFINIIDKFYKKRQFLSVFKEEKNNHEEITPNQEEKNNYEGIVLN